MIDLASTLSAPADAPMAVCLAFYVLGVIWFVRGMRRVKGESEMTSSVSVVIAARDEAGRIEACLKRLKRQEYPAEAYEVIVVDDGSGDGTPELVREMQEDWSRLKLLSTMEVFGRTGSKKRALSLGIEKAEGEIVLTTDADCLVGPGWVRGMVRYFTSEVGMVVGFSQVEAPGSIRGLRDGYEGIDFLNLMGCICGSCGQGRCMAASGQNLAYRRSVFAEVGGYEGVMHRSSGDDVLLLQRVRGNTDWRILFATDPETFAIHPRVSSLGQFLSKRMRWASNAPMQIRLDPLFFLYMVVTFALDSLLVFSPLLVFWNALSLLVALGGWVFKGLAEFTLFRRAVGIFGRGDLVRYFPFWMLLQPLHVVVVGGLGSLGFYSWKGNRHRWGRRSV